MTLANDCQGFTVIPLQFSSTSSSCHELFVKEHSVKRREENKPPGQTLFILNVPPYATEESLKYVFSYAGKVTRVILEKTNENYVNSDGFKRAFIVFSKRETLLNVLKHKVVNHLSSEEKPIDVGLGKWIKEYNFSIRDAKELQGKINSFMSSCEQKQTENKLKEEVIDDEGWTLVTKGGRKPGLSRKESVYTKLNSKALQSSKQKELKNFYTFQIRESQMKNIAILRRNFEEAKAKVNLMKQARKFKPY